MRISLLPIGAHTRARTLFAGLTLLAATPLTLAETSLSPAEQAALAAVQPESETAQRLIAICHHLLVYGAPEKKAEIVAELGDKTCTEAVNDGDFGAVTSE